MQNLATLFIKQAENVAS